MFAYKLTIKTRKSRKAKLEKFITALESSDLTKIEQDHIRKQIAAKVRDFYALAKKYECLPMTVKQTFENEKVAFGLSSSMPAHWMLWASTSSVCSIRNTIRRFK